MEHKRKPVTAVQFERPSAPGSWSGDARRYTEQVNRVFEDIYQRYGRLGINDLSRDTRELLESFAGKDAVADIGQAIAALASKLAEVEALTEEMRGETWAIDMLPVGMWLPCSVSAPPSAKWWFAEGQALSLDTHPQAYALFGAHLPNVRGRVLVGLDEEQEDFDALHKTGGAAQHTLVVDEMPAHSHGLRILASSVPSGTGSARPFPSNTGTTIYAEAAEPTGGGEPHNNLQPYITVRYIVKVLP